jgi:hypothetical protein
MKRALLSIAVVLALGGGAGTAQESLATRLSTEVASLTGTAERVVPQEQRPALLARLGRAKAAIDANRLHLALYEVEGAYVMTHAYAGANELSGVKTSEEFAARWRSAGEPRAGGAADQSAPNLVRAMAASAARRAPVTYRAALPYGQDAGVSAGAYYLGEARALADFADFARRLPWKRDGAALNIRSIQPELDAFDAEVTTAYETMTPAEHPTYIVVSVLLKRARSLSDNGDHAGALLEYLLARLRFAPLRKGEAPAADTARLSEARARLDAARDHSIARMFLEMAEAALEGGVETARRNAGIIAGDVLPAYHAALGPAARTTTTTANADVTITLVRWPFT